MIGPGDVQWMTAGSGIIHEEMPQLSDGRLSGFQLWANLPASHKMMNPRYRDVTSEDIANVVLENGVEVKVIAGQVNGVKGPVTDVVIEPEYLDVYVPSGKDFEHQVLGGHTVFAYSYSGSGKFTPDSDVFENTDVLVLYDDGDIVSIHASTDMRFLLVSGRPLNEPIAWRGPIVMNSDKELRIAFSEYRDGTFLKHKSTS
jgi:redox-sensitive bicupin YhaK (pirin superfamily)